MKSIALANRLSRDLDGKSFTDLSADARLEILDAINAGLQRLNSLSPNESRITTASIPLAAPAAISFTATQGSPEISGYNFTADQLYCTIRIDGDGIDNQVIGQNELLHPYAGASSTVTATVFSDAAVVPEPYDELVSHPRVIEPGRELSPISPLLLEWGVSARRRQTGDPLSYCVEANARNQNPPAPSVIRLGTLPGRALRLQTKFTLAPARVSFADLLASQSSLVPFRAEHIEVYLLPVCRGILSISGMWKNPDTRSGAATAGEAAAVRYETLVPRTLSTPRNIARTKAGF